MMATGCFPARPPVRVLSAPDSLKNPATEMALTGAIEMMISRTALNSLFDQLLGKSELGMEKLPRQKMEGPWVKNTIELVKKAEKDANSPLVWAFGQDNLNFWV